MAYPNSLASGSNLIQNCFSAASSAYCVLGQPSALTSVLNPSHEFTIIVRCCMSVANDSGVIIAQADNANTTFSISCQGGNKWVLNIGGVSFNTGNGSVKEPTWHSLALVCQNVSGTFKGGWVMDGQAGSFGNTIGSQVSPTDIMIGASRGFGDNTGIANPFPGFIGCIAIYNYAMTSSQIHSAFGLLTPSEMLYTTFNGTNFATGLVAYYPCNETVGVTMHDVVQGLDGTANNYPWIYGQYPKYPALVIGDSLCNGAGSQTSTGWQLQLVAGNGAGGMVQGRAIATAAWSGQNVTYIQNQLTNTVWTEFQTWTWVFLPGAHDFGATSTVLAFLALEIARLPHDRYLIIGQVPYGVGTGSGPSSGTTTQDWGTTGRTQFEQMNRAMQQAYGARYLNVSQPTVSLATLPGEANDVFQQRTPAHVVSTAGAPHPQDAGYIEWSIMVDNRLSNLHPMW